MLLTGILHRWHLAYEGIAFATVIPGREEVHIKSHQNSYWNIDRSMSYQDYEKWIEDNGYMEVRP